MKFHNGSMSPSLLATRHCAITRNDTDIVEWVKDDFLGVDASEPADLANINGTLYFSAEEIPDSRELWISNDAAAGTLLVKDINSGGDSFPDHFTNVNGILFFICATYDSW